MDIFDVKNATVLQTLSENLETKRATEKRLSIAILAVMVRMKP